MTVVEVLLALLVLWIVHDLIWPSKVCKASHCQGGKVFSPVGTNAFRACRSCGGSGRHPRLMARIIGRR